MRPRHTIRIEFLNSGSPTAVNRQSLELHFGDGYPVSEIREIVMGLQKADEVSSVNLTPVRT